MVRGTTPTLNFILPFSATDITILSISFSQLNKIIFEKKLSDCTINNKTISCTLTENETLLLQSEMPLAIQLRVGIGAVRLASNIIKVDVNRILKDGVLNV